jgi:DNA ligase (NAD+)
LVCTNIGGCKAQLLDYLAYYTSRNVTNMVGVAEEILKKMLHSGLIKSPADLYTLTEQHLLEKLERQGETSARNIVASIQSRRKQPLEMFLVSLGVRSLGRSVSARLANHFHILDNILNASEEELLTVENFARTMARNIYVGLKARQPLIDALLKHITLTMTEKIEGTLTGKSFCLTGHIEFDYAGKHYDARPDIEDLIKSKGGVIKSVSKVLNFLVVGGEPGSKVEKAQKAGVTIINGADLLELLEMPD